MESMANKHTLADNQQVRLARSHGAVTEPSAAILHPASCLSPALDGLLLLCPTRQGRLLAECLHPPCQLMHWSDVQFFVHLKHLANPWCGCHIHSLDSTDLFSSCPVQLHEYIMKLSDTITVEGVNALARSILSAISHYGREAELFEEAGSNPLQNGWAWPGPTWATSVVACLPTFMDASGNSTGGPQDQVTCGRPGRGDCTAGSWLMPGGTTHKILAAQQAAWGYWQASVPASPDCKVWRPTYQSGPQVGACSQACGLHVEHHRCL